MITLACKVTPLLGNNPFLPLLSIIERHPFPSPIEVRKSYSGKNKFFTITSFIDKALLEVLAIKARKKTHIVLVDNANKAQLEVCITQSDTIDILLSNEASFINHHQAKTLFYELIKHDMGWLSGGCHWLNSDFYVNHFTYDDHMQKTILTWLQYFGKLEVEKRGGFVAFESNPYLRTERIHDGLFVQVGDDPAFFDTPEGAKLLVNAVNALPFVQH
jgi:hypothetical protein